MEFTSKQDFQVITTLHNPFTGEEKFDTIEETLVKIQCAIKDEALNNLNIMDQYIYEVEELFGNVLYEKDSLMVYGHSNRVIVIKYNQDKVVKFKYMRLKDAFKLLSEDEKYLMQHILSFD